MQNKYCSADEAGYVALNSGWRCDSCGCQNGCWDCCSNCGWNRCGCGVVRTETRQTRESCSCSAETNTAAQTRGNTCEECPKDCSTGKTVQCCQNNTRLRSACDCNGTTTTTARTCDSCNNGTTTTSRTRTCGCEKECDSCNNGTTATSRTRSCGCEKECDSCNNGATTTSRTRTCGCERECDSCNNGTTATSRARSCGCERECDSCNGTATTSRRNSRVGMVYAVEQEMERVYESESALRTGTLFPSLHKPMNGYCPGNGNCADEEQEAAFAAWDLRLYLNTHPDDEQAKELFRCLCREADDPNYATAFLNDGCCSSDWDWTDDPWPWECRPCGE